MAKDKKIAEPVTPKPVYVEFPIKAGKAGPGAEGAGAEGAGAEGAGAEDTAAPAAVEINLEDWQVRSGKAMEQVVASLQEIARQIVAGMEELPEEACPAEMNLWFGIDSHADAGAVVAFNPKKATFSARMVWYPKEKPVVSLRQTPGLIPPAPSTDEGDED